MRATLAMTCVIGLVAACGGRDGAERPDAGAHPEPAPAVEPPPPAPAPRAPLTRGSEIAIPAGIVRVGSMPGTPGRDPRTEADLVPVEVPAFSIDRLPYPNDPAAPPRTGITRDEAASLCEADGKRLCTELEWERACKGETTRAFAGGNRFDVEGCSIDPLSCASPLDVVALGTTLFEWTGSDVSRGLGSERWSAVARGGRASDPVPEHRCGARHALAPGDTGSEIGFRCCRGELPVLAYPEEPRRRTFREEPMESARARQILSGIPELARFAADFEVVDATGVDRALGRGGHSRESVQFYFVEDEALVWSPMTGEELFIVAGTGAGSALVAVLYLLPDGTFVHAASFVLHEEPVPIVLAWDRGQRDQVLWSACWGCAGEGGSVTLREDRTVVVTQR